MRHLLRLWLRDLAQASTLNDVHHINFRQYHTVEPRSGHTISILRPDHTVLLALIVSYWCKPQEASSSLLHFIRYSFCQILVGDDTGPKEGFQALGYFKAFCLH